MVVAPHLRMWVVHTVVKQVVLCDLKLRSNGLEKVVLPFFSGTFISPGLKINLIERRPDTFLADLSSC